MDPMTLKVDTQVLYLPPNLGFLSTILIHIHGETEELVQDQNGMVTPLGLYPSSQVFHIKFQPRYSTPHHISQLLHQFYISQTQLCQVLGHMITLDLKSQLCQALGYRIALACDTLLGAPGPFELSFDVKLIRQVLIMLPPSVISPSRAVSDHVLQRLVDKQRVESTDLEKEDECSICMENLSEESSHENIIRMPSCLHLFHQGCIFEWLKIQNSCPLCRRVPYEAVAETPRLA